MSIRVAVRLLAFSIALASQAVRAEEPNINTANGYYAECADLNKRSPTRKLACVAYTNGLVSGLKSGYLNSILLISGNTYSGIQASSEATVEIVGKGGAFCLPANVSNEQLVAVLIKFMDQHPELRHGPTSALAFYGMVFAFPPQDGCAT